MTVTKEYVLEVFDVAAFHYLLKPIDEKKFTEIFDNAVKVIQERRGTQEATAPTLLIKTKNNRRMLKLQHRYTRN